MSGDKKTSSGVWDERFAVGLFILFFICKIYESIFSWMKNPENKPLVIAIGASIFLMIVIFVCEKYEKIISKNLQQKSILAKEEDSIYCGQTDDKKDVWLKPRQRTMHTQVVGTTNAGKTESVILPWAIQDLQSGKGILIIDGKADSSLIDKLLPYIMSFKREKDFRLFSLSKVDYSHQFNPLLGGSAEEITERVFNSFEFENEYYKSIQFEVMNQVMRIFEEAQVVPTFQRLHQAISRPKVLEELATNSKNESTRQWIMHFKSLSQNERETRTSGLLAAFSHFSFGEVSKLFNANEGVITIDEALKNNQIVYFQLPVLSRPFLGKATGKLVLQSLQAAIANRHAQKKGEERKFFSVFLDDFSEYLYGGFPTILNKSRSANVGIVFAHQALGDIQVLGDPIANTILSNTNLKIIMRGNDPDSAEYFAKVIGTKKGTKVTERQKAGSLGSSKTGDGSIRETEEFSFHPNLFKRELGVGEAVVIVPHEKGAKTIRMKFSKADDLSPSEIPRIEKTTLSLLSESPTKKITPSTTSEKPNEKT